MLVSRADITGLVDQLTKRGLAERLADQNDRRVWIVKITKKGESLLEAYLPGHYKEIRDLMVSFSRKDKAAFNLFLEKLRSTLK
jgi:DNA-binding MarR family transcriptional regulator